MKHVGVNVCADPLFTVAYTGVNGGLVLVSADDPGMHSSQNEQDNRHLARAAKIPVLEPSDSQEAKDFTKLAFALSEQFDTPVMLRLTTRVAHSQSLTTLCTREERPLSEYRKDALKYVMIPAYARQRHVLVEERLTELTRYAENTELNRMSQGDLRSIGIITGGAVYNYVMELYPEIPILKLGMSFPLPPQLIKAFAATVGDLYVIEELEGFWEEYIRSLGIPVKGREIFPATGELLPETIAAIMEREAGLPSRLLPAEPPASLPARPPVLCPGCPHRGLFYVLQKLKLTVSGDIGCYTLGCLNPLNSIDTTICMGASIGGAIGMEKARGREFARKLVAVIGDSTFIHSGITGLVDAVYNHASITVIILDNRTTGMTGHQDNPVTGKTLKGETYSEIDLAELCRALGVKRVETVDPFAVKELERILKAELNADEPSVIITRRICALLDKTANPPYTSDSELCTHCGICLRLGCPAITSREDGSVEINPAQCTGCGLCGTVCHPQAIRKGGLSS
jgi:indolepyruvate ferredoxin oxidoreductase alpha subunit